jgi:hypothetical protein
MNKHIYFSPGGGSYLGKTKKGKYTKKLVPKIKRRMYSGSPVSLIGSEWRGKHITL